MKERKYVYLAKKKQKTQGYNIFFQKQKTSKLFRNKNKSRVHKIKNTKTIAKWRNAYCVWGQIGPSLSIQLHRTCRYIHLIHFCCIYQSHQVNYSINSLSTV